MPKPKRPRDINQLAKFIVDVSTGDAELPECQPDGKNPAAVELGRLGGKKGGKARADKLTPEDRQEIARHAAMKSSDMASPIPQSKAIWTKRRKPS